MSWQDKAVELCKRFGAPSKFAAKMILGAVVPGGPAVAQLVGEVLDCVHETVKDNWKVNERTLPTATQADWRRVEEILDLLSSEVAPLMEKVAKLDGLQEKAAETIRLTLATDAHCRDALRRLDHLARCFDRLEEQNKKLLQNQGFATSMLAEMLPLMRRMAGVADYMDDLCTAGVSAADFRSCLHEFQDAARAFREGHLAEATAGFQKTTQSQPGSAAAATALAGARAASQDFPAAEQFIARAARLRPDDAELAELHRRVTLASRGATMSELSTASETWCQAPKVGDTLDGWKLELLLGHGSWGRVFKASRGIETRALKVMHPNLSRDPLFVERFKKEILTLASLRGHKNLIAIDNFGYAAEAGCWYFVMDLIEGTSLEHYLQKHGPLKLPEACPVFLGLADGLAAAHDRGIIHRDIKPANILVRRDGTPVLVDFGLAAIADDKGLAQTGSSAGYTAMFAAPEQLRGKPADIRSDIYSLAAALYYALIYDQPAHREPDQFDAQYVPEPLREFLKSALDHKPERRPPSAAAFLEAWRRVDAWLRQKKEAEERQRAEEERKRREAEEEEKKRQELLRRYEEEHRQAEVDQRRQEGDKKLRSFTWAALGRTQGKLTQSDVSAAIEICTAHGVSTERAKQVLDELKEQWERRHREEAERLRKEGENKLAQFIRQTLERTQGKLAQADATAAKEICQKHSLSGERANQIIKDAREDWTRIQARKKEKGPLPRQAAEKAEARQEVEPKPRRSRRLTLLVGGSAGTFGIVVLLVFVFRPSPPPEPSPEASPPPKPAVIEVKVDQPGAKVQVDEGKIAEVPRANESLKLEIEPGKHKLRISKDNFEDDTRDVELRAGESLPIAVQLKRKGLPLKGALELVINEPGVEIFINGKKTPIQVLRPSTITMSNLEPGKYEVVARKISYEDFRDVVDVTAGKPQSLTIKLMRQPPNPPSPGGPLVLRVDNPCKFLSVAFSPDGKRIVTGSDELTPLKLWDTATGAKIRVLAGHTGRVESVAFSPDGKWIASSSASDHTLRVWDADTGQEKWKSDSQSLSCVAFSPDSKKLVVGGSNSGGAGGSLVKVWDAATGQAIRTIYSGPFRAGQSVISTRVHSAVFSPDGKRIIGDLGKTLKVWDASTKAEIKSIAGHANTVFSVAVSRDGRTLASCSISELKLWDASTGQELLSLRPIEYPYRVAFSLDGKLLVCGGGLRRRLADLKVLDATTGKERLTFKGHTDRIVSVDFRPDSKQVASASEDGTVRLWPIDLPKDTDPKQDTPLQNGQAQGNTFDIQGMKVTVLKQGEGEAAKNGDRVSIRYKSTLQNGKAVDSREVPFAFILSENRVIKGLYLGVVGMKKGEKRQLVIPPELAYGKGGFANIIPKNATLIYEIEMVSIHAQPGPKQ